jgi:uncharacterized protein
MMTARNGKRSAKRRHRLAASVLDDIVQRIVKAARPEKIILFGSAARGTMGPDSDVDLLVIKGGRFNRTRVLDVSYRALWGVDAPVDVIVVTPEEVEQYRDASFLVIHSALREGKVVYGE